MISCVRCLSFCFALGFIFGVGDVVIWEMDVVCFYGVNINV